MASKRELVIAAVEALIIQALPNADVVRNRAKAAEIGPGGTVNIRDGDPGEPDVALSPLTYTYAHRIELELGVYESASKSREEVLDDMLTPIAAVVMADRTLGGLCTWLETEAAVTGDIEAFGVETGRWADTGIVAVYDTPNPLT